ncbi:MAG: hypothetical protein LAP85_28845 [Acidobacteriia bacterium]|nr:hypothetical protein [Terriglobia bacterium]
METENTGQAQTQAPHAEHCICESIAAHLIDAFGLKSAPARQHLRNARIEMLKAMRSLIDERIDHLSRERQKGTKVAVD